MYRFESDGRVSFSSTDANVRYSADLGLDPGIASLPLSADTATPLVLKCRLSDVVAAVFPQPRQFGAPIGHSQFTWGREVSGGLEKLFLVCASSASPGHRVLLFRADRGLFSFNYYRKPGFEHPPLILFYRSGRRSLWIGGLHIGIVHVETGQNLWPLEHCSTRRNM